MLRLTLAILAGYATMAILVVVATAITAKRMLHAADVRSAMKQKPTPAYLVVNLTYSALFAVVGGGVAVSIASTTPQKAISGLAGLIVIMSIISIAQTKGTPQPKWYGITLMILGVTGVALGGYLRSRS